MKKRPDQRESGQKRIRNAMIAFIIAAFGCMIYATFHKCSWKTNLAVICAIGLILIAGLLKILFDKNEVKYYNN